MARLDGRWAGRGAAVMMARMVRGLGAGLAVWVFAAALVVPVRAAEPHRVPDTLAERVQACTQCHGKEGRATPNGYFPRIAGKPAGYLYQQLLAFRDGRRHNTAMKHLVGQLSDAYLREIAGHFAGLDLPYPPPTAVDATPAVLARGALLVRQGDAARDLPACTSCHGAAMTGVQPSVPGLLGLPRDYLTAQLGAWQTGQRRALAPDCMAQVAQRLTPDDVQAVAAWLAARPVPARPHPVPRPRKAPPLDCGSSAAEAPR